MSIVGPQQRVKDTENAMEIAARRYAQESTDADQAMDRVEERLVVEKEKSKTEIDTLRKTMDQRMLQLEKKHLLAIETNDNQCHSKLKQQLTAHDKKTLVLDRVAGKLD